MNLSRKKELLNEWKNRRPEMGLVAMTCKKSGEMFVGISTDTQFAFNSHRFQLSINRHPNKQLQQLWQQHGEEDNQTEKLTSLLEEYLEQTPQARRISR